MQGSKTAQNIWNFGDWLPSASAKRSVLKLKSQRRRDRDDQHSSKPPTANSKGKLKPACMTSHLEVVGGWCGVHAAAPCSGSVLEQTKISPEKLCSGTMQMVGVEASEFDLTR